MDSCKKSVQYGDLKRGNFHHPENLKNHCMAGLLGEHKEPGTTTGDFGAMCSAQCAYEIQDLERKKNNNFRLHAVNAMNKQCQWSAVTHDLKILF